METADASRILKLRVRSSAYNRAYNRGMKRAMKCGALIFSLCVSTASCYGQTSPHQVSSTQLQAVLDLPLDQAVKLRETYKGPLKVASARQAALEGKDCQAEIDRGQQPYNICMGHSDEQADNDSAVFYNNLQMLCRTQDELTQLQAFEGTWLVYREGAMKAAHASWPDGTGASGFASQVYLSLVRSHMRLLAEIYGLNIAQ